MRRLAPLIIAGIVLAVAPITGPDIPVRVLEYVKPPAPAEATLVAVGDIMLSRIVAKRMRHYGADYPFASTADFIRNADIAFGNLESPIAPGPEVQPFEMTFRADPEAADALKDAGFDILSLANNHIPNLGPEGILETLHYLDAEGIMHVGAGKDAVEAGQPMFIIANGIIFGFLAYNDSDVVPLSYEAGDDRAGTALMRIDKMIQAVKGAQNFADIVIVSMHSGTEYAPFPNKRQVTFARAAIDAGTELVLGHHPHVIQPVEVYNGKYIFYSLGNFIFDQMWSDEVREGLAVRATFTKDGLKEVSYHPVLIEDYAQPRLLEGGEARKIIEKVTQGLPVDSPANPL
ncbi:hypothetical protein A3A38_04260 [Candidatus Kaiserbacteria bacterium RIFCSPLOWO2_01_FULL_53_17]|uniref:Capsule synthesis protein CapA domain-containing protein n=1 Tax=Candidatus Kaiserbacteria bacterium RIFCSPLOWO2_01_FULL_53_17 TaxID=1798511 RepID=A0A1F6EHF2_9BACT|nr:MAG: hypothetical protein A3A38_04260 [Candidatus Kaiserbacteria bacterium RIFCSPLOWO2_01_FULL_53_17]